MRVELMVQMSHPGQQLQVCGGLLAYGACPKQLRTHLLIARAGMHTTGAWRTGPDTERAPSQ